MANCGRYDVKSRLQSFCDNFLRQLSVGFKKSGAGTVIEVYLVCFIDKR